MSFVDITILVLLAAALIAGYHKGALGQLGSIVGIVVGYIGARLYGHRMSLLLFGVPDDTGSWLTPGTADILGCTVMFAGIWLLALLASRLLRDAITVIGLGTLDRLGGSAVMCLKLLLVLSILVNVWIIIEPDSNLLDQSSLLCGRTLTLVTDFFPWLMGQVMSQLN